ncbi:MAG: hypothetical protein ACREKN_02910 [Longimicrobiaceae bacterium]
MEQSKLLRVAGLTFTALVCSVALVVFLVKDQMSRHRRDLFSPHTLRRLAALGYLSNRSPSVESATLLRDYLMWERRPLLRRRASALLERVEKHLDAPRAVAEGA